MLIFVFELRFSRSSGRLGWRGQGEDAPGCAVARLKDARIMQGATGSKGWRRSGVQGRPGDKGEGAGPAGLRPPQCYDTGLFGNFIPPERW